MYPAMLGTERPVVVDEKSPLRSTPPYRGRRDGAKLCKGLLTTVVFASQKP